MKYPDFKQKGVILLLLLLVFLVAGSSMMLGTFNNRQDLYMQQQAELSNQLQLAKEALLAFAANSSAIYGNSRGPGFFPCSDTADPTDPAYTGMADAACSSNSINLGRLPKYIEVDGGKIFFNAYYAGINQQFWYAIAPRYIYSETVADDRNAVNRTSIDPPYASYRLTLDTTDNVVALIIAPGEALGFQDRTANSLAPGNFLEGGNEDLDASFFTTAAANPDAPNDRIMAITHDELMTYVGHNVASEIKRLLDLDYQAQAEPRKYPGNPDEPDPSQYRTEFEEVLVDHPWLDDAGANYEQWASNTIYTVNSPTQASIKFSGCANMSFTIKLDEGVSRNGNAC